jgi:hypothetical protein
MLASILGVLMFSSAQVPRAKVLATPGAQTSITQESTTSAAKVFDLNQALAALLSTSSVRIKRHGTRDTLEGSGRMLDAAKILSTPGLPNIDRYRLHLEIEKKKHARRAQSSLSRPGLAFPSLAFPPLDQINRLVLKKFMIHAADFSLSASGHAHLDRHGYVSADIHINGHGLAHVIDLLVQAKLIDEGTAQVTKLSLLGLKAWKVLRGLTGESLAGSSDADVPPRTDRPLSAPLWTNLSHPTAAATNKTSEASDHIHVQCKDRRLLINDLAIADLKPIAP